MRPVVSMWVAWAAVAALGGSAVARPTVAVAGVEAAGDSVGVDVEAVGIARELSRALRRAADGAGRPLQLVDPMVIADDVEALVWGKLIRDGESWVATVHLSAVGADGDTVSYRAVIPQAKTSSLELATWGVVIYDSLLDQIDLDDKDALMPPATVKPAVAATAAADPFTTRVPPLGSAATFGAGADADADADALEAPATVEPVSELDADLQLRLGPERAAPDPHAGTRRLFWISAGLTAASALFWAYAAVQVDDAEDQLDNLAGCTGCDRAINAANSQGNRWEGISWLAGTATVAGTAAVILFGYQAYVVGRRPAASELVGTGAGRPRRAFSVAPVLGVDRIGAGMTVAF